MSDLTIQLLRLINEGKTLNEISEILNISHKKIFNYFVTHLGRLVVLV
mgnify:CR=1